MAWDNKKYCRNRYKNDPIYRQKCIDSAKNWQRNNKDKFSVIQNRYYIKNKDKILSELKIWRESEDGRKWIKNNYKVNGDKIRKSMMKYYFKNVHKWDRYRYKWILSDLDIHDKNYRVAKLFIKRINKISNYRIDKKNDIKIKSNGKADIKIKIPNKADINNIKDESKYWSDNFNKYCGTKIKLGIKTYRDIKSSYKMIVTIGE
jgi:ribonuclease BN (tRNA processing enzyme)